MKKVTFVGLKTEKERFIKRLQEVGVTHLDLGSDASSPTDVAKEMQRVNEIRRFLNRLAEKEKEKAAVPVVEDADADYAAVCARREELGQKESRLQAEIATLKKERLMLEPWGDFDPNDMTLLKSKGLNVHFFRVSRKIFDTLPLQDVVYHITRQTEGEVAFVAFSSEPLNLGVPEEKLPAKSISGLDAEIARKEAELKEISAEYVAMSAKVPSLLKAEDRLKDDFEYRKAMMNAQNELEDRIFILTCWSPIPVNELMEKIGSGMTFSYLGEDPVEGDRVPVLLQNKKAFESGEDLVKIYSQPNYSDFDPSGLVLYWFTVFYGIIIGDAGYGFTLLALTIFLHMKVKSTSPMWLRLRRLNYMLSASVIFFGLISASYFGMNLAPDNPLNKLILISMATKEGQDFVMLLTIILGMMHISLALIIKFYRTRDLPSLGWVFVIWAGLFFMLYNGTPKAMVPKWIMIAGLGIIILFSSNHRNFIVRILIGVNASLGIVQLFADILSYLRLFALGLATMYMCQTFNLLARMAYDAIPIPYVGILPAVLILIAGHSINIVLGIMGGVVHGLRLNFLEWYRWCFEGDGLPFKPFKVVSLEHNFSK